MSRASTGRFRMSVVWPSQLPRFFRRDRSAVLVMIFGDIRWCAMRWYAMVEMASSSAGLFRRSTNSR